MRYTLLVLVAHNWQGEVPPIPDWLYWDVGVCQLMDPMPGRSIWLREQHIASDDDVGAQSAVRAATIDKCSGIVLIARTGEFAIARFVRQLLRIMACQGRILPVYIYDTTGSNDFVVVDLDGALHRYHGDPGQIREVMNRR